LLLRAKHRLTCVPHATDRKMYSGGRQYRRAW